MSKSRKRLNQRRLACVLGFTDPACCTIPIRGVRPCAVDCTGRLIVEMTRDFADGKARAAGPWHTCDTSGVLAVNTERPSGPGVRPSWPDATNALARRDVVDLFQPQELAVLLQSTALKQARSPIASAVGPTARRRGRAARLHLSAAIRDRGIDRRANSVSL
jgi:hypothetical protein